MREILFRGKDIYGKWFYGDLINLTKEIKQICNHTQLEHAHSVNPDTVGQYTGLTDKNGKKIFEGDIVHSDDLYTEPLLVIFNENCGEFQVLFNDGYSEGFFEKYAPVYHLKVIGNIHDNPELLRTPQNDEVRE